MRCFHPKCLLSICLTPTGDSITSFFLIKKKDVFGINLLVLHPYRGRGVFSFFYLQNILKRKISDTNENIIQGGRQFFGIGISQEKA